MTKEQQISFKSRVCSTAIRYSRIYHSQYVSFDYLIFSDAFHNQPYYIISAEKSNYLHLIGVSTNLSPNEFFEKCFNGTLCESDFELSSHGHDAKESKGSIRRKIKALPYIDKLISCSSLIEENFQKNAVSCAIASSDGLCTLGFAATPKARPKTLLIGNELNISKASSIKIILKKSRLEKLFDNVQSGEIGEIIPYYDIVKDMLGEELRFQIESLKN